MLIGLTSKARSGKTTMANRLTSQHNFVEISFAKPLKEMASRYFNIPYEELYGNKTEFSRRVLQGLGHCIREEVKSSFWLDKAFESIKPSQHTVISDVRYLNEAKAIKKKGGILIKIERENCPSIEYGTSHSSEMEQEQFVPDIVLFNNASEKLFISLIDKMVKEVKEDEAVYKSMQESS